MAKIELKYVSKMYDNENYGLNDFSVSIESGTFVTVLGNSGSGKSTLLKVIAGLLKPDAGEVYIDDQLMNNVPPQKRDIAMMFQEYVLYPHYNVYDNIASYLRFIKTDEESIRQKVLEVSKLFDIEDILNRRVKEISGGQMQRVALARICVRTPSIILLDEPLSNVDEASKNVYKENVRKLRDKLKDTTFIYVTHHISEALSLGEKVLIVQNGRNVTYTSSSNLVQYPLNMNIAQISSFAQEEFHKGKILNNKLYINDNEVIANPLYLASINKDYKNAYIYKNGDYHIAFDEFGNLIDGNKKDIEVDGFILNNNLLIKDLSYEINDELRQRIIVNNQEVKVLFDKNKFHKIKNENDIKISYQIINKDNKYSLIEMFNERYLIENTLLNGNNVFYYNINEIELLFNDERVLMHYKVYENKIPCKKKGMFLVSKNQNIKFINDKNYKYMIIPIDAIATLTNKKQTSHLQISQIISEEYVSDNKKLVYAIVKGFEHYVSFYTSSSANIKYHCKMYANIDLNKIKLEV